MSEDNVFDWESATIEERKAAILAGQCGHVRIYTDDMTMDKKIAVTDELFRIYGKEINCRIHQVLQENGESQKETQCVV